MTMTVSAAALSNIISTQQGGAASGTQAPAAKGMFDDLMSALQPSVEQSPWSGLAAYGQGSAPGAGGNLPSPWATHPGEPLSAEKLAEMAREMKIQSDTRSVASAALHKVLEGIQDTARTLTRQG